MSNIIKTKEQLQTLKDTLSYLKNHEINKDFLEEILTYLGPKNNGDLLINYNIREKGIITAQFVPSTKSINISINKINSWLENNAQSFELNDNDNILKGYLFLYVITHEIEHAYQYLIGESIIEAPNNILKEAYKHLMDLLNPPKYILPHPIKQTRGAISTFLYKARQNYYLLERNANIESMDLISNLAKEEGKKEIYELFLKMRDMFLRCGYIKSNMGSIEETYREILMYDKFKKFTHEIDLSEEDKMRLGLGISEEARIRILSKKNKK